MAASGRYKGMRPLLDEWGTREKLALVYAVQASGDQNWGAVSRHVRQFAEEERPEAFFSPKNCASQYANLLDSYEAPKRKRAELGAGTAETRECMMGRRATTDRIEELKREAQAFNNNYTKLKNDIDEIKAGLHDDKLEVMVAEIENRLKKSSSTETSVQEMVVSSPSATQDTQPIDEDAFSPLPELTTSEVLTELDFEGMAEMLLNTASPDNPLDKSKQELDEAYNLSSIKDEPYDIEGDEVQLQPLIPTSSEPVKTESKEIKQELIEAMETAASTAASSSSSSAVPASITVPPQGIESKPEPVKTTLADMLGGAKEKDTPASASVSKEEVEAEEDKSSVTDAYPDTPVAVKDDPSSPVSSVVSGDTDGGSSTRGKGRRSRGSRRGGRGRSIRPPPRINRTTTEEDSNKDSASKASDLDSSDVDDDDADESKNEESDNTINKSLFGESVPNSPASGGPLSAIDEDEKAHKVWKKSIMFVWRGATNHKHARVFNHPVTDEMARGYSSMVYKPKDLVMIKKDIEAGHIRTTAEFHRDMLLMLTNAIMYNNSKTEVFKWAIEMFDDVDKQVEQYNHTQMMVGKDGYKNKGGAVGGTLAPPPPEHTGGKLLRGSSRRSDAHAAVGSDKEEENSKKRRMSLDADQATGGKLKKMRKT